MTECVMVMTRTRPMNKKELDRGCKSVIKHDTKTNQISVCHPDEKDNQKSYTFDAVFDETSRQKDVYMKCAYNMVENVAEGYNATVFAYGQTGCGKTHSMMGVLKDEEHKGIVPRSFTHIFGIMSKSSGDKDKKYMVSVSFIEIYNEEIRDQLSEDTKCKKDLRESPDTGVYIVNLNKITVHNVEDMLKWMNMGNDNRSTGETAMNAESSRSHSVFTVYVETMVIVEGEDKPSIKAGKLNLVDLAGSERQSKTQAVGDRLKEAKNINLSLSALGNVIAAQASGKKGHIPYRDSKLTRLLQDSLGGNTKTLMIAALSPADYNYDETLGTLKYANRAKQIKNAPKINEDPKDAKLREFAEEIAKLKKMLAEGGDLPDDNDDAGSVEIVPFKNEDEFKGQTEEQKKKLSLLERQDKSINQQHNEL